MLKKIISFIISIILLFIIYANIDISSLSTHVANINTTYCIFAILLFYVTTHLTAIRWKSLVNKHYEISNTESIKLILAASSLNLVFPSKLGDILKCLFAPKKSRKISFALTIYEKILDFVGLSILFLPMAFVNSSPVIKKISIIIVCIVIIIFILLYTPLILQLTKIFPKKFNSIIEIIEIMTYIAQKNYLKNTSMIVFSYFIWFVHILQFFCFFYMFNLQVPFLVVLVNIPVAIYSGLIPISIAGIGIRDWTIIKLLRENIGFEGSALIGIMATSRYIIPAFFGIPFLAKYIQQYNIKKGFF